MGCVLPWPEKQNLYFNATRPSGCRTRQNSPTKESKPANKKEDICTVTCPVFEHRANENTTTLTHLPGFGGSGPGRRSRGRTDVPFSPGAKANRLFERGWTLASTDTGRDVLLKTARLVLCCVPFLATPVCAEREKVHCIIPAACQG